MDTIFALATARGRAGVAVVRISGPGAFAACRALCGALPEPRVASLRSLRDSDGVLLDRGLALTFPGPESFTGEDVAELHLHGSTAVIASVLRCLGSQSGLRHAEPGEFTRRALENGRLDLTEVEGLADLIEAETEAQRRQALQVLSGALGDRVDGWRRALVRSAALLEASIDFADEEVPEDVSEEVIANLRDVSRQLSKELAGLSAAERIRSGFEVALVGAPNVGKSTLLNMIAGRDAAITSEIAGTTRDVIEVRLDLDGLAVTFLDTAGVRETDDVVESIGVKRTQERAARADVRVFLTEDGTTVLPSEPDDIVVRAKGDLGGSGFADAVSGLTGDGVDQLLSRISDLLQARVSSAGLATRERHRHALTAALEGLEGSLPLVQAGQDRYDIAAEEIRTGIRALEMLIGHVDVEDYLDEIFRSFCIGK